MAEWWKDFFLFHLLSNWPLLWWREDFFCFIISAFNYGGEEIRTGKSVSCSHRVIFTNIYVNNGDDDCHGRARPNTE